MNTAYHCNVRLGLVQIVLFSFILMKHWNLTLWKYIIINDHFMIKTGYSYSRILNLHKWHLELSTATK